MGGEDSGRYWDPLLMQQTLSPHEKELRDTFVKEYLKDYNVYDAAIRVGYIKEIAAQYGAQLIQDTYVQREIARLQVIRPTNQKEQDLIDIHMVRQRLWMEGCRTGPGTSHAARVMALSQLKNLLGADGTKKVQKTVTHRGGVMMVPAIANVDEWEKAASKSQDKLIASSTEDRQAKPVH